MRKNRRHKFSSTRQMLQYGSRNNIGPFANKRPILVPKVREGNQQAKTEKK